MIKKAKTIAEYAFRKWLEAERFELSHFNLTVDGDTGVLVDQSGDSMVLEYDRMAKSVSVRGEA